MSTTRIPSPRLGRRRLLAVAGVSALVLAGMVGPSSATGSSSASVSVSPSVNGVAGAPAFTGETSTVGITVTNQSLTKLAGYLVVVPKGIGPVTSLGVSNSSWTQTKRSCGLLSNCSALYLVLPKSSSAQLPKGASITSSFGVTPPSAGTASFRLLGIGSNYSGLVLVGAQPTVTIVDGVATDLLVSVTPPVVAGEPNQVTVKSVREYPEGSGTYTPKVFPGPLSLTAGNGDSLGYTAPNVAGQTQVTFPVTFPHVQVSPQQTLIATSGSVNGSTSFDVVAAGVVSSGPVVVLTGAGGTTYTANLPNGATGPVSFTEVPCDALSSDPDCDTEVNLFGNFKNPDGTPRYSNDAPATIEWTCPASECPATPPVYGSFAQDQVVDFQNYRIEVSLLVDGSYTPFTEAEPCNPIVTDPDDVVVGKITDPAAQAAGFCIDVYAISRAGGSFSGALTIPVLFVEDPKLRGI